MGVTLTEEKGLLETWAVLELMGHRRLGGFVREVTVAGAGMLRIDVYGKEGAEPYGTQFYPPASVYCLTPATEATARAIGEASRPRPTAGLALPAPDYSGGHYNHDCDEGY